jgi:hypothetical protein
MYSTNIGSNYDGGRPLLRKRLYEQLVIAREATRLMKINPCFIKYVFLLPF